MADYNKKLSELHQRVVQDKLRVPATIDESGWVQFKQPGLGDLTIHLREYNPEYMNIECSFEGHETQAHEDLMRICNSLNHGGEIAQLSVSNTSSYVSASVRLLLASPGRMPDEALVREVIGIAMSSIKSVAAQLGEELPKLERARKSVNDHLSLAYRPGMTADALFEAYRSSPAFAQDSRAAENMDFNLNLDFFHPYGYGKKRAAEMCASVGNPGSA